MPIFRRKTAIERDFFFVRKFFTDLFQSFRRIEQINNRNEKTGASAIRTRDMFGLPLGPPRKV